MIPIKDNIQKFGTDPDSGRPDKDLWDQKIHPLIALQWRSG